MQHKRSNGQRVGNVAYGYRSSADGKHVETEPTEQEALAEIHSLRQQGLSLREIAAALNGQALCTRRGARCRHENRPSSPPRESAVYPKAQLSKKVCAYSTTSLICTTLGTFV